MDLATQFKAAVELHRYGEHQARNETSDEVIRALAEHWVQSKPKPKWWICDSAKSFEGRAFSEAVAE
eukprot:8455679-Alexandrium_andersonii.AAC.1